MVASSVSEETKFSLRAVITASAQDSRVPPTQNPSALTLSAALIALIAWSGARTPFFDVVVPPELPQFPRECFATKTMNVLKPARRRSARRNFPAADRGCSTC